MNKNNIIILILIAIVLALLVGIIVTIPNANKQDTNLIFNCNSTINEGDSIEIKLTDANGNAIANQTINVTISDNDKFSDYHSVITNENGVGILKLDKSSGEYEITISFNGNDRYNGCNATKKITIGEEEVAESQPVAESSQTQSVDSENDKNYYHGYSRNEFSPGEQAAIDEARANGYDSPADYYKDTGNSAGQSYVDAHPEEYDRS